MQEWFCYVQSAFRLASQTSRDNWVSVSERVPQHDGFQELPGRRGRARTPPYRRPVLTEEALWQPPPTSTSIPETTGVARPTRGPECGHSPACPSSGQAFPPRAASDASCASPPLPASMPAPRAPGHHAASPQKADPPRSCSAALALEDTTETSGLCGHSPGDGDSGPLLGRGTGRQVQAAGAAGVRKDRQRDSCATCTRR